MQTADDVLTFWFEEHGEPDWFGGKPEFDALLADRFAETHAAVARGEAFTWRATSEGRLAEIIVLDQFSRQLHRGRREAFAQDAMALALAQEAVAGGHDLLLPETRRSFFYMPYMHSESMIIHEEAMRLFTALGNDVWLGYEVRHRGCLARFGRYPARNAALGRTTTEAEQAYLAATGGSF